MATELWMMAVLVAAAGFLGFWLGRSTKKKEDRRGAGRDRTEKTAVRSMEKLHRGKRGEGKPPGRPIGSPVAGQVTPIREERRFGAMIRPEQDKLYAPVSGRILKLYPMGNAMLIGADSGVEVVLSACTGVDELFSMYFRARVVAGELVNKGKLLMEFDREGLERQGVDVNVSVSVEALDGDPKTAVTQHSRVTAGEDLLWA